MAKKTMPISYGMCWEDPAILVEALNICVDDTVLSIASGGENVFALLLKNPKKIVAVDINPHQLYLLNLKKAAIEKLEYHDFTKFLGFEESQSRWDYFKACSRNLPRNEYLFWEENRPLVEKGIVHSGKLSNFIAIFRRYILSITQSKKDIAKGLSLEDAEEQLHFYNNVWNNWKWKMLIKLLFSKKVFQLLGRKKEYFKYSCIDNISGHYVQRFEDTLTKIPIKYNYFLHYALTSSISVPFKDHPYLDKDNFYKLKTLTGKIQPVCDNVQQYLKKAGDSEFTKFNMSNVFELFSQREYEDMIKDIIRTAKPGSILCYWNNLVSRDSHAGVKGIYTDEKLSGDLFRQDRALLYSKFIVERITKDF